MMYFDFDGGDEVTDGPIRSGCEAKVNHQEAFATLMSFLGAAAESYRYTMQGQYSDNSDLFPPKVMEWAYQNQNDIDSLAFELEETKNLIEE